MQNVKGAVEAGISKGGQIDQGFGQVGPTGKIPPGDADHLTAATVPQQAHQRFFITDIRQKSFKSCFITIGLQVFEEIATVNEICQYGRITCTACGYKIAERKNVFGTFQDCRISDRRKAGRVGRPLECLPPVLVIIGERLREVVRQGDVSGLARGHFLICFL